MADKTAPAEKLAPVSTKAETNKSDADAPDEKGLGSKEMPKPRTKEQLYRQVSMRLQGKVDAYFAPVAKRVQDKHGTEIKMRQVFGDQDARDLLVLYFVGLFDILLSPGTDGQVKEVNVGIPGGFGSLQLTTAGATTKKTPQGQTVEVQKRWRVKYSPGKSVDDRLDQLPPPPADAEPAPEEAEAKEGEK